MNRCYSSFPFAGCTETFLRPFTSCSTDTANVIVRDHKIYISMSTGLIVVFMFSISSSPSLLLPRVFLYLTVSLLVKAQLFAICLSHPFDGTPSMKTGQFGVKWRQARVLAHAGVWGESWERSSCWGGGGRRGSKEPSRYKWKLKSWTCTGCLHVCVPTSLHTRWCQSDPPVPKRPTRSPTSRPCRDTSKMTRADRTDVREPIWDVTEI